MGRFSSVAAGSQIGVNCILADHVGIETDVRVGQDVSIGFGTYIASGAVIEDGVQVGTHVSVSTEHFNIGAVPAPHARTTLRQNARIGAGAILLRGVTVGSNAIIEPGSVVSRDIPPNAVVGGNPATIRGYVTAMMLPSQPAAADSRGLPAVSVAGVALYALPVIKDIRGTLSAGEFGRSLPFIPKRYFIVYEVTDHEVRGEHAHRELHQFLVCVKGSLAVVVDDGERREEILLDSPGIGVHIPPMVWATQYKYSRDAVLLVLASERYEAADYIRDYDDFQRLRASS